MNNDDAQRPPEAPALNGEVGNQLRKAREAKGMSVAQVADAQHLRPSVIQAIEEGQYEKIGSELFLKGYVRTYAEQVGLNPAEVIEALDWELEPMRQQAEEERHENPLENIERRKQRKRRVARWVMLSLLLVAVVGVGIRLLDSNMLPIGDWVGGNPPETVDEQSEGPATDDSSSMESGADEEPAQGPDEDVAGVTSGAEAPVSPEEDVSATDSATMSPEPEAVSQPEARSEGQFEESAAVPAQPETPSTEAEPSEAATPQEEPLVTSPVQDEQNEQAQGADIAEAQDTASETETADEVTTPPEEPDATADADVLSANFTGDCWVSVENGAGQTVIASLKRAGDNLRYEGQGPFRVVLGAADAATLNFNGEVVDLSRYPAPNNRVALTLGN
ncbi:DUF4115 domain-containing protein [Marinobacter nanhaiticus D15-8W]|uniref:Helix-turn-helix domain-containing protein n=1 Tax=Marinobacter nanhaiticus D15-8W TaxID=626887 RepID=N6WYD8_9GAMM|nr:RodZ domain-containing protein [Marinobacter nanhaiticus]ENO13803.1 helix-turn-helix domain-containing protein [Marinobacter nanhaiticus D15-8W]BES71176.1 DUF4115 domain-containing protein [Marinobacter nanhaiticus D15-8W]